jgi:alpha-L-rhamnosidase
MYADVLNWMYRCVLGLKNTSVGYKTATLMPYFYSENSFAEGSTETPYGEIFVKWERFGSRVAIEARIPREVTLTLKLQGYEDQVIASGKYEFTI